MGGGIDVAQKATRGTAWLPNPPERAGFTPPASAPCRDGDWTMVDSGVSGAKGRSERPQFDALLNGVARREFDMIAAWSVDRLGRSLQDLLGFLMELQSKRVDLYLHQQALDTSTPMGKAMFQLCGVFAELERSRPCRVHAADRCRSFARTARPKGGGWCRCRRTKTSCRRV